MLRKMSSNSSSRRWSPCTCDHTQVVRIARIVCVFDAILTSVVMLVGVAVSSGFHSGRMALLSIVVFVILCVGTSLSAVGLVLRRRKFVIPGMVTKGLVIGAHLLFVLIYVSSSRAGNAILEALIGDAAAEAAGKYSAVSIWTAFTAGLLISLGFLAVGLYTYEDMKRVDRMVPLIQINSELM